jgi:hypothetical protein
MASMRNRIHKDTIVASKRRRKGLFLAMIVLGILVLAWFDGGEEPIHPISQEIILPGAQ